MPTYVTGEVDKSLLAKVECLIEENRVLRNHIGKRIVLTDVERRIFAEKAVALRGLMADPETILRWHRRLVVRNFDGSRSRTRHVRLPVSAKDLVVTMAKDNPSLGLRQD